MKYTLEQKQNILNYFKKEGRYKTINTFGIGRATLMYWLNSKYKEEQKKQINERRKLIKGDVFNHIQTKLNVGI
jgi:hypothetical protein